MRISRSGSPGYPAGAKSRRALTALVCITPLIWASAQAQTVSTADAQVAKGTPVAGAGRHSAEPTSLSLPGRQVGPRTLTLVTGDRVSLSPSGGDRYTVTTSAMPRRSGPTPPINATSHTGKGSDNSIYAIPADAAALVRSGAVDKELFNVSYLAEHGNDKTKLPVVVQFAGHSTASALAQKAADLPASSYVSALPAANAAQVSVDTSRAATFWNAVTATATPDTRGRAGAVLKDQPIHYLQLAKGITKISLTGHDPAPATGNVPADEPIYTVREIIHGSKDTERWCGPDQALCLNAPDFSLLGVTGPAAENSYAPAGVFCVEASPCTAYELDYRVPAGVYTASGDAFFVMQSRVQIVNLASPQVSVAADTTFELDANNEQQIIIDTPLPNEPVSAMYSIFRGLPDGSAFASLMFFAYGYQSLWAVPTPRVTVGTFHVESRWLLTRPQVTMKVTAPEALTLHPLYPIYYNSPADLRPVVRFPSQLTAPVVNAGGGSSQDFAGIDARGKIALIRVRPFAGCLIYPEEMANAVKAGAVGALFDPTDSTQFRGDCGQPLYPTWWRTTDPAPPIPYASISLSDAQTLIRLLASNSVVVKVNGGGPSSYLYPLTFSAEGRVPDSLHYAVPRQQLVRVDASFHSSEAGVGGMIMAGWRPDETLSGGVSYENADLPSKLTEYFGPATPDYVTYQELDLGSATVSGYDSSRYDVFSQAGSSQTAHWGEEPQVAGVAEVPLDVLQSQPGKYNGFGAMQFCSVCRQGNTFYPFPFLTMGAAPRLQKGPYVFGDVHLYEGDQEFDANGGLPTYTLPPDASQYRLTIAAGSTSTEWHFASTAPAEDRTPDGTICVGTFIGGSDQPCEAASLVFLRYDAGLDLNNAMTGAGRHQMEVTAYHQTADAPAISSLKLWTSIDDGATWQAATIASRGHGDYQATFTVPAASTSDTLSIKAQARDADGNDVSQTIGQAFALTHR